MRSKKFSGAQRSNGHEAAGFIQPGLETAETEAAPHPRHLRSGQRVSEDAEASACPWRVQSWRKQRRRASTEQESAVDTTGMVKETAS